MKQMKATAIAPSNIAFVKYMGRKDEVLRLPENGSISMNSSNLLTHTTVEFSPAFTTDSVVLNGEIEEGEQSRVIKHLDRVRKLANIQYRATVISNNNFPTGTGLSSSSSGFAALTVAAAAAAGLKLSEKELSILARQGSGSACRSIPDGFVIWHDGNMSEESFAESLYLPEYWDIADVVAVIHRGRKEVPTSIGHMRVADGPYYKERIARMPEKMKQCIDILKRKDFEAFGAFIEEEALDLHAIFMTAGMIYLEPGTLDIMKQVRQWRQEGLSVYFTINTGQDIHLICQGKDIDAVKDRLNKIDFVRNIIVSHPGKGAHLLEEHLF